MMWRLFLKKLSCGIDPKHDAETIKSFSEHFHVPSHYVMARMKTFWHTTTASIKDTAMVDRPTKPKTKSISDWLSRPYAEYSVAETRRSRLWQALIAFIHSHGGFVVSPPGAKEIKIEILKDSDLPTKLARIGYVPRHFGVGTRITSSGFMPVDVIEITLGK